MPPKKKSEFTKDDLMYDPNRPKKEQAEKAAPAPVEAASEEVLDEGAGTRIGAADGVHLVVFDHHIEAKGKDGKIDLVATLKFPGGEKAERAQKDLIINALESTSREYMLSYSGGIITVERHAADTETIEWVELSGPRVTTRLTADEKSTLIDLLRA